MRHVWLLLVSLAVLLGGCRGGEGVADGGTPRDAALQYDGGFLLDAGDAAPADAGPDARPDGPPYVPTAQDIEFAAVNPLPSGEQILFNDWNPSPNRVYSMTPDGQTTVEIFRAFRVWSMAASRARDRIAFSCGDPDQEAHYGLTIYDSIQHTWSYDVATQAVTLLAYGNINDECHHFGPGDTYLYLCRRYDFQQVGTTVTNRGYRVGRIDLADLSFTFLTPDVDLDWALTPQVDADGAAFLYARIQLSGSTQTRTIMEQPLPTGTPVEWRAQATFPVLSPDGTRVAFQNWADGFRLWIADRDGSNAAKISDWQRASSVRFSPDGTQVAFLGDDSGCSHIEAVKTDGSEVGAARRLRDCTVTGEFITELDWISR
jgi:hypothetical protein